MLIIDDIINAIGASNAAAAQERSAREALDFQKQMWGQQRADQAPWLNAGRQSLADLVRQMGSGGFDVNASTLANDPGFQFRMAEGQKALERSASARGGLNGGGTMRSLARYSQGLASDEYQRAWGRQTDRFNRLASLAGVGQSTAQGLGALGAQHAGNVGNLYGAIGNAQAAGAMGQANAISGGVQSAGAMTMAQLYQALGQQGGVGIPQQPGSAVGGWGRG